MEPKESQNKQLIMTPEKLEQVILGFENLGQKIRTFDEAVAALDTRQKQLEEQFGKLPIRKGVPLPGHQWAGAESPGDGKDLRRGFIHWLSIVSARGSNKDTVVALAPEWVRGLTEGTDSEGGHLVPQIFIPELVRLIEERAVMRNRVRTIPMTTDESKLPSLVSSMSVYWPGESQETTESDAAFGEVKLTAKTCAAMTHASLELAEDAQIDLADLLATLFAEALADEEDKQILNGTGAPFTGILNHASANITTMGTGLDAFTDVSFNDIADVIGSVSSKAKRNAMFYLHRTILTILMKVRDLNHQYIWGPANPASNIPPTIWGYPYVESDQMPYTSAAATKFIAFGNPQYTFLGDRKKMTVKASDEVGFKTGDRYWKVTERIAVVVGIPAAYGVLKTAA